MTTFLLLMALTWAQGQATTTLDRLAGRWSGTGTVNAQKVTADAHFERVLQGRFTRLQYTFKLPDNATFEGHGYYTCENVTCRGQWFDSQGSQHVLSGALTDAALTSEWGDGTTPRGRSEYKLTSATTMIVTDWVRTSTGEWREFGRVEYWKER